MVSGRVAFPVRFLVVFGTLAWLLAGCAALATPAPTPTLPPPTWPPTSTSTPTATATPTPEPTATPLPLPVSQFALSAPDSLYPPPPLNAESAWLLQESDALVEPPLSDAIIWKKAASFDPRDLTFGGLAEPFYYTTRGESRLTWQLDVPLPEGVYALYFLDTVQYSAGPQAFTVLLDGEPANPYRGWPEIIPAHSGQTSVDWLLLGFYSFQYGQTLAVQADIGPRSAREPFAFDRLLVLKIPPEAAARLEPLPSDRPLRALADDDRVTFYEQTEGQLVRAEPHIQRLPEPSAWNGSLLNRDLTQPHPAPVIAQWRLPGRLPAGIYELWVWIPAEHATIAADYDLLASGRLLERLNPAKIRQGDFTNQWISLGLWSLPQEAALTVQMTIQPGETGLVGADAITLVFVP